MPTRCSGFFYVSTVKQRDVARRSKRSRYGDASDTEEKCSHRIAWTARIPVIRMKRARSYRERDSGIRSKIQLLVQRVSRAGISQVERLWKYLPRSRVSARWRFGSADARKYHHGLLAGLFRTTVGYQAASVRTDGSGITTGGFGFTGLDILSFGTIHRNIAFGVVYTPGLGSAGFGTGASDSDLESAFVRLMRLERFLGMKDEPGRYLVNLKVRGNFELDVPFSEKRSPTLNTPFVLYHYTPGTPYTATIGSRFWRNSDP